MSCLVAFHYRSYGTFCIYSKRLHNFHGGFTHYRNYRALVLGSLIAFLVFLPYPIMIIKRLKNEEQVLSKELTGYTEYQKKVRYRLIPYIW